MSVEVKVPNVGESVTEVFIGEWFKNEGDTVSADENLVEVESDKATFEIPAPSAGVIEKIVKQPGDSAEVGETIAIIKESDGAAPKAPAQDKASDKSAKPQPEPSRKERGEAEAAERLSTPKSRDTASESQIMPAARRALAASGLRAEQVQPTGPGGRLLKEDVMRHVSEQRRGGDKLRPSTSGGGSRQTETVPMTPIRRRIAERLVDAQQNAALLTTFNDVDMSNMLRLRNEYKEPFQKKYGAKLGFMSFFVKAAVDALRAIPQLNAQIDGDQIVYHNYCDIGVAIGGGKGLIVPVLRNAERMSFADIERTIADFADRAQKNKVELEELQGGTFTISNGGVYGSLLSTPIINPPQSGVLGMHRIEERPVAVNGQVVIRPMMYLALTYDHRIVDGREAVTFLKRIKDTIEEPSRILLEV